MIMPVRDLRVDVREAAPADVPLLLSFIRAMAAFEKLSVSATEPSLHAALFGDPPAAQRACWYPWTARRSATPSTSSRFRA